MDVSATGQAAVAAPQVGTITGTVAAPQAAAPAAAANSGVTPGAHTANLDTQSTPAPIPGGNGNHDRGGLAPAIAKLFAVPSPPAPIRLNVSYRVSTDSNVITTVFSDPKTGQEVAQFPPELLVHLSQFFDQPTGVTLDRDA